MDMIFGIVAIIVVIVVALTLIGKAKGAPDPSTQTDAWLQLRFRTESAWIDKYLALPRQQRESESLKRMYEEKQLYVKQIIGELTNRTAVRAAGATAQELGPILQKAAEFQKGGASHEDSLKAALEIWKSPSSPSPAPLANEGSVVPKLDMDDAMSNLRELLIFT